MSKAVFATLIALATIGAGISDANAAPRKGGIKFEVHHH